MQYPHITARIFGVPLMIAPDKARTIIDAIGLRLGMAATDGAVMDHYPTPRAFVPGEVSTNAPYRMTEHGVAVVPVLGTLVHRAAGAHPPSMMWSYGEIDEMMTTAANDPAVRGILLDIDSPGGEVSGAFDLADRIRSLRGPKPIWAVADEWAMSAAYALASAADRVVLPRTAAVGSVGVIVIHRDQSVRDAAEGFKYTIIHAGARKADLNPHRPLSKEGRVELEAMVETDYELFVSTVARNRNMNADAVRATEAAIFTGQAAVDVGLADAVMPFREALQSLSESLDRQRSGLSIRAASAAHNPGIGKEDVMSDATQAALSATPAAEADPVAPTPQTPESSAPATTPSVPDRAAEITEIVNMCALAGKDHMAAGFIAEGAKPDAVRAKLLATRAAEDAAADTDARHIDAGGAPRVSINAADIYAKRRAAMTAAPAKS